jgi:N-acetylneuraminate synthase
MNAIDLGPNEVGEGHPPFLIAEIGSNHNGDMDLCRRLIDAAVDAGADAVKFQSWTEQTLVSQEGFELSESLRDEVQQYQFTPDQHREIQEYCSEQDIPFCTSVFSEQEADLLENLGVPFYKIASMDINNLPLLRYVAQKGRPMIVSTGMATLGEIEQAVTEIQGAGNDRIVLLHCVSVYPPDIERVDLRNMEMLKTAFGTPVGFSDHTLGTTIPLAAVARGACLIEKHFTVDKDLPGWDHAISANPEEFGTLVEGADQVYRALGTPVRTVGPDEREQRAQFRRSAVAQTTLREGDTLSRGKIEFKRPGYGIAPNEFEYAIGRIMSEPVEAGHVVRWHHVRGKDGSDDRLRRDR